MRPAATQTGMRFSWASSARIAWLRRGLSKRVTSLTEQGIGWCMELVLEIGEIDVGLVVGEVVLSNFMG